MPGRRDEPWTYGEHVDFAKELKQELKTQDDKLDTLQHSANRIGGAIAVLTLLAGIGTAVAIALIVRGL